MFRRHFAAIPRYPLLHLLLCPIIINLTMRYLRYLLFHSLPLGLCFRVLCYLISSASFRYSFEFFSSDFSILVAMSLLFSCLLPLFIASASFHILFYFGLLSIALPLTLSRDFLLWLHSTIAHPDCSNASYGRVMKRNRSTRRPRTDVVK